MNELREKIVNDILLRLETTVIATHGSSDLRGYGRNEAAKEILDAVIAALPQLKKRSEGNHDYLLGRSHGFDDGIDEVRAMLQSAKENR